MYTIFGGGAKGYRIGRLLQDRGAQVTIVEQDASRASWIEQQGIRCIHADMRQVDLKDALPAGTKAVLVAVGDPVVCEISIRRLRATDGKTIIIAFSTDEDGQVLKKAGADIVLAISDELASSVMKEVEDLEARRMSQGILGVIKASAPKGLAIFCHDNPDADTLASAWALQHICEHSKVKAVIYYVGVMNMPQSKELVKVLGIRIKGLTTPQQILEAVSSHEKVALVDSARPGENNSLPPSVVPAIVVDHHSTNMSVKPGEAYDIRGNVGSASTLMTSHLINLGVPMDVKLATALFYGIKTDTDGFTANVSTLDLMSAAFLSAYVYKPLLDMFELPQLPRTTVDALGAALKGREVRKHLSIAFLGELPDRSALPLAVDLLMQEEGVSTAVAIALVGDTIQLSARNKDKRIHVGEALHLAFKGMGSAGGHATSAGGQIHIASMVAGGEGAITKATAVDKVRAMLFEALR